MTSIGSFDYFGDLIQNTATIEPEYTEENSDDSALSEEPSYTEAEEEEVEENTPTKVCKPYIRKTLLTTNEDNLVPMPASSNAKAESKSSKKPTQKKTTDTQEEIEDTPNPPKKAPSKARPKKKEAVTAAIAAATAAASAANSPADTSTTTRRLKNKPQPKTYTSKELQPIFQLICKLIE